MHHGMEILGLMIVEHPHLNLATLSIPPPHEEIAIPRTSSSEILNPPSVEFNEYPPETQMTKNCNYSCDIPCIRFSFNPMREFFALISTSKLHPQHLHSPTQYLKKREKKTINSLMKRRRMRGVRLWPEVLLQSHAIHCF